LANISDRSPLPNAITPNIVLPQPSVKEPTVNFAPPSNEIEDLPPFDSLNPSLGSALTLGSLRHDTSSLKIDDERSMFEMARPNVSELSTEVSVWLPSEICDRLSELSTEESVWLFNEICDGLLLYLFLMARDMSVLEDFLE
jgi:hypothetical protein